MDFNIYPKDESDRAYEEGRRAREEGKSILACPYRYRTELEDQWTTGYYDRTDELDQEE